jgi:hypothetical protein
MSNQHRNGYQLNDLQEVVDTLMKHVEHLEVQVSWSGHVESTASGKFPTVDYEVSYEVGEAPNRIASNYPAVITTVPSQLSKSIVAVLKNPTDPTVLKLLDAIEKCPIK